MSTSIRLPFADLIPLNDHLMELIVDEAVELTESMVGDLHEALLARLSAPFGLLVNKQNAYTYTWEAQPKMADLAELEAVAVLVYNPISATTAEYLGSLPRKFPLNLEIFRERDKALSWLEASHEDREPDPA